MGWGWGASSYSRNNTVSRNRIDGVLSPVLKNLPGCLPPTFNRDGSPKPRQCLPLPNLADGGHIYTQEIQKSLIFGNHLTHDANRCKSSDAFSLALSRCGLAKPRVHRWIRRLHLPRRRRAVERLPQRYVPQTPFRLEKV